MVAGHEVRNACANDSLPRRLQVKTVRILFDIRPEAFEIAGMGLPYKIATLLYCFNEQEEILLLERAQEPNRGFWSPCGGKLKMDIGESPYACAIREAKEEICVDLKISDLHLAGIVSEHGYQGQTHWLMFLFEVKLKLKSLPKDCREGKFRFFQK